MNGDVVLVQIKGPRITGGFTARGQEWIQISESMRWAVRWFGPKQLVRYARYRGWEVTIRKLNSGCGV